MNISSLAGNTLAVQIDPNNADQALVAGVQFARAMVGADVASFIVALNEQVALIQTAIVDASYSATNARLAAKAFEVGAKTEWRRIANLEWQAPWETV